MRLIDADALIEILAVMQGRCNTKAELIHNSKIWQQVKDMPTVEAIPVEWMRKFKDAEVTEASAKLCDECKGDFVEWMIAEWLIYSQYVEGEKKEE